MRKQFTICFIRNASRVLLAMKKRGFGAGRWNGYGGKVHDGEDIKTAARRELQEEAGLTAQNLEPVGILEFRFKSEPKEILEAHIFNVGSFEGEPHETEEMKPRWFTVENIPYEQMWSADRHWLPLLLDGRKFRGRFFYLDEASDVIIEKHLEVIETL